ncbi:hypothetical protein B0H19DRAFT_1083859 [Mycena capillaripes]|nr:hypothetical protein B0H19DRAFT_1083859 [Mycena capillaripes]
MCLQSDRDHIAHNAPDESLAIVHKGTDPHKLDSYILSISILSDTIPRFPVPQPRSMASPYLHATLHLSITTSFSCSPLAWSSLSSSVCFIDQAKCRHDCSVDPITPHSDHAFLLCVLDRWPLTPVGGYN